MAVNGIQIQENQVWETAHGYSVKMLERILNTPFPWMAVTSAGATAWFDNDGKSEGRYKMYDLKTLVIADGCDAGKAAVFANDVESGVQKVEAALLALGTRTRGDCKILANASRAMVEWICDNYAPEDRVIVVCNELIHL